MAETFEFYVDGVVSFSQLADLMSESFSIDVRSVVEDSDMWSEPMLSLTPRMSLRLDDLGGRFRETVVINTDFVVPPEALSQLFSTVSKKFGFDVLAADLRPSAGDTRGYYLLYQKDGTIVKVQDWSADDSYDLHVIEDGDCLGHPDSQSKPS